MKQLNPGGYKMENLSSENPSLGKSFKKNMSFEIIVKAF